jgi:hypothetical protein
MASFDKYSNYKDNAGVSGVVFGAEKPILEVEMNEVQEVQKSMLRKAIKNLMGDGITDLSKIVYEGGAVKVKEGCALAVDGYMIESTGLSLTASSGTVYLQVWEETATYSDTLKEEGNQQDSVTVANWFKDNRSDAETSRRKVVKYNLASSTDSNKHNLAIASVADGVMTRLCKEISFSSLSSQVIDLRVQMGTYGEGVLGVEVDLENNSVVRTGDNQYWSPGADYDNSPIYGGRKRCVVKDDGTIVAFYGEEGYTETGALTVAVGENVVGTKVQCMVMQPAFYYKRIPLKLEKQVDDTYQVKGYHMTKWVDLISPVSRDGFSLHPAFKKGDTEIAYYLIGENDGCLENSSGYDMNDNTVTLGSSPYSGIKMASIAGAKPASGASAGSTKNNSLTRDAVRKVCANRGTGWQQLDFTIASAEQMLFVVEYSTFNIQAITTFGSGVTDMPYVTNVNDSIPNPTNTALGNGSGKIEVTYTHSNGTEYTKYVPVYRGVKNPFGNIWKFVDGFLRKHSAGTDKNEAFWQDGSKAFSDAIADYIACGFSCATAEGYVKAFGYDENCDWCYMTSLTGGDSSKPVGDYYWVNMSSNNLYIALLGAYWDNGAQAGLFYWTLHDVASYRDCIIGGRLCRKA